jgi:transforming growth factor-beta-induced protein
MTNKIFSTAALTLTLLSALVTPSALAQNKNIMSLVSESDNFSTLEAAIRAADLADTLSGTGPFTVLAPTNDAFGKIPKETLDKLLLPVNKDVLKKVLTYHVIGARADSAAIAKLTSVKTVEGSEIAIKTADSKIVLNGNVTVVTADIIATNGIVHAIDSVLVPPTVDLSKLATTAAVNKTLSSAETPRTGGYNSRDFAFAMLVALVFSGIIYRTQIKA